MRQTVWSRGATERIASASRRENGSTGRLNHGSGRVLLPNHFAHEKEIRESSGEKIGLAKIPTVRRSPDGFARACRVARVAADGSMAISCVTPSGRVDSGGAS